MIDPPNPQMPFRTALAAAALGAAAVFLPHWDPTDHWAAPDKHVVGIIEQADDDAVDPDFIARLIESVDALRSSQIQ